MMDEQSKPLEADIGLIGGGPVGALLACLLAMRGFEIDVYERRPDLRTVDGGSGRSINLALSTRGLTTLKHAGLEEEVLKLAIPMRGRMIHAPGGGLMFQQYGKDDSEYINSISRSALNQMLLDHAEKTGKVAFHFRHKAKAIDTLRNSVIMLDEATNTERELLADIVIGCDGAASAIRNHMHAEGQLQMTEQVLDYGYKELTLPAGPSGSYQIEKNALHIWPRGTFMLIALPNLGGSFTCTLFLPLKPDVCTDAAGAGGAPAAAGLPAAPGASEAPGAPNAPGAATAKENFESLKTPEAVLNFFKTHFSDAMELIPDIATAFFDNPTGHMSTVKCDPWNAEGRVLLLGDAAHAIVPFFGQGMNCGFEDVMVLDQCMTEHIERGGTLYVDRREHANNPLHKRQKEGSTGWHTVFKDFVQRRKANADAIADLAVENFIEMRDKVANPQFMLEKAVEKRLQLEFPGDFISRYRLVTFTNVPYVFARAAGEVTDEILHELCLDIQSADQVDLKLAEKLIKEKLAPLLKEQPELASVR